VFFFRADDEPAIAQFKEEGPTIFEGWIEGEPRKVPVTVTSFTSTGLAFFEGTEEAERSSATDLQPRGRRSSLPEDSFVPGLGVSTNACC
jgi:hypothetical protein